MGCVPDQLGLLELAAIVGGVFVVGWLLRFFSMLQQLLRSTFHPIEYRQIDPAEVPSHLPAFYERTVAELRALGFVAQGYVRVKRLAGFPEPYYSTAALLWHAEAGAHALVDVSELPDRWRPVAVTFWSFCSDGPALLTLNGSRHNLLDQLPNTTLIDPYAPKLTAQWHAHRQALNAAGAVRQLAPEQFLTLLQAHEGAYVDDLVRRGRLRPREGGPGYEMAVSAAVPLAAQAIRGHKPLRRMFSQMARAGYTPRPLPLEEEVALFERVERLRRIPGRRRVYMALFLLTAVLFTLSMAVLFDPQMILMLSVVVLIHELGHYAAMRAFGYADTTIFFLPFLGAATMGRRDGAPAAQELVILLAGPLPGLVLAGAISALYTASPSSWQHQALLVLVIVNLFNLLPIFPLDGGRVLHTLIFRRHRWLEAAFLTLAGLVLFAGGLYVDSKLLALIGVAVAVTVPHRLRVAQLLGHLRQDQGAAEIAQPDTGPEHAATPRQSVTRRVFRVLDERGYRSSSLARRFGMARGLLQRNAERRAGLGAILGGLLTYAASLAGGLVLLVAVAVPQRWADESLQGQAQKIPPPPADLREHRCAEAPALAPPAPDRRARRFGVNLYVDCEFPRDGQAEAVEQALGNFFAAAPRFTDLRPPWVASDLPPRQIQAQEQARATYRRLQRVAQRALRRTDTSGFYRRLVGCDRTTDPAALQVEQQGRARRIRARRVAAVRAYLVRESTPPLDRDTAELYLRLVASPPDHETLEALAQRMGRLQSARLPAPASVPASAPADGSQAVPVEAAPVRPVALGELRRAGRRIVLPYLWLPDEGTFDAVKGYLCRAGCEKVRVAELRDGP